jgi:hypothetical protein
MQPIPSINNNIELKLKIYLEIKANDDEIGRDKKTKLVIYPQPQ